MADAAPLHQALARVPEGGTAQWIYASDGVRLRLAHWNVTAARGTVFLLPGRTEYIEKYGDAVSHLTAAKYEVLVIDWRGQGLSDRLLDDPLRGHVPAMGDFQHDLNAMIAAAEAMRAPKPWFVLSHSMGGAIALRHLIDAKTPFSAAAFSAPMLGVQLPPVIGPLVHVVAKALANTPFKSAYAPMTGAETYVLKAGFSGNLLTRSQEMWAMMGTHLIHAPELTVSGATVGWLAAAFEECEALAALPSPDIPAICSLGLSERVVESQPIRDRMAKWPSGKLIEVPDCEHEVMMSPLPQREAFFQECIALFDANH
jgi:lysophospholipase